VYSLFQPINFTYSEDGFVCFVSTKLKRFIGRIGSEIKLEDLERAFEKYGQLKRCEIHGTFGFITYKKQEEAEAAIKELNLTEMKGSR
jgi:RNA recognition motif-containing protein